MKKSIFVFTVFSASAFFMSCKKDSGQPSGSADIQGTWSFESMDVTSSVTEEYTEGGVNSKVITTTSYITSDNAGSIVIDGSTMTSSNLSYSVNTSSHTSIYENGALFNSADLPFTYTAPPSSGTASYSVVNSDSIHFSSGSLFMSGVTTDTQPSGARIDLQGNILYLTQYVNQTGINNDSGIPVDVTTYAKVVAKLQKN